MTPDPGGSNVPPPAPVAPLSAPDTHRRKWVMRAAGVAVAVAVFGGTWVGLNASALRAKWAVRQLACATTDEDRARWADEVLRYGEPGVRRLIGCAQTGADPVRAAAVAALERHLNSLPDGDARAVTISGLILGEFGGADAAGTRALMQLVPTILNRTGTAYADRCRALVVDGLKGHELDTRLAAARLAIHPDLQLRAELKPLLGAAEPELRAAALFGVATADGEPLLSDEDLFRWLHDPDAGVRRVCRDALVGRDRSEAEIALARRLSHADPTERLKLLLDLRFDNDVPDPEPWLERLSRDPEPAVRAGSVRVAVELATVRELAPPWWVGRVADADPHPTVRFIAAHYRARTGAVRPAGAP